MSFRPKYSRRRVTGGPWTKRSQFQRGLGDRLGGLSLEFGHSGEAAPSGTGLLAGRGQTGRSVPRAVRNEANWAGRWRFPKRSQSEKVSAEGTMDWDADQTKPISGESRRPPAGRMRCGFLRNEANFGCLSGVRVGGQALRPADREKTMVRRAAEKLRVRQRSYLALG